MEQNSCAKYRILIIEDDAARAGGLCRALQNGHIETVSCGMLGEADALLGLQEAGTKTHGPVSAQRAEETAFDLVLLDVNLPDGSGFDYLQQLKRQSDIVVILLTANDLESDIVAGLEMGADDYITKPFSLAVLRARVETQLRRVEARRADASAAGDTAVIIDDYSFCFSKMLFWHGEEQIALSKTEQKLLRILVENRGITLTRERLLDYIWSVDAAFVDENALSVTVKRLRDKLGAQDRIKTVYGMGYRWE